MRYAYHDLYPAQFEKLALAICTVLLGPGVQPFSSGRDGGRDARFLGTALDLPNAASPHNGQFVVQAKHTEHPFAKCSDKEFSGDAASSVLSAEIPRIKQLVDDGELDHYLLFSNRRVAGSADATIRKRLMSGTGARSVEIFGIERIEMLLKLHPRIATIADISEMNAPLRVSPDDLAEVISALAVNKDCFAKIKPTQIQRTAFAHKNAINGLGEEFASIIKREYLPYFADIRRFLAAPPNNKILERYLEAAAEFTEQLAVHRHEWDDLGEALVYMQTLLFERDGDLAREKRLTKRILYYMYWNCDLGRDGAADAEAEQTH